MKGSRQSRMVIGPCRSSAPVGLRRLAAVTSFLVLGLLAGVVSAQSEQHQHQGQHGHHAAGGQPPAHARPAPADARQPVSFPAPLKAHTLANMRDHLLALAQIQRALAAQAYDQAAELAEHRLGMSSLPTHGAHEVARFMPPGMRDAGTAMHRAASRFAIAARDAATTGEPASAIGALSDLTTTCVACHASYRLE